MLEFETTYDKIRVYFNSRAAFPYVFSLDDGNQNNEILATSVVGQGVHRFEYNGQEPNPNHPVAWIEYRDARVHRIDKDGDEFFVENDSGY